MKSKTDFSSLPVLRLNSETPLPEHVLLGRFSDAEGKFYRTSLAQPVVAPHFSGETIICACPNCEAPVSVRMWLNAAVCWKCEANISIDEIRLRELAEQRGQESATTFSTLARRLQETSKSDEATATAPLKMSPRPRFSLDNLPAFLSSLLVHLLLLILLALWHLGRGVEDDAITLSTSVGPLDREDVVAKFVDPITNVAYDLPVPKWQQPETMSQRDALVLADKEARAIRMTADEEAPDLPDLFALKRAIGTDDKQRSFAVRDPRIRVEMIRREGGTTFTEAAVARGLEWMAHHQEEDGSWSLHRFHRTEECDRRCRGAGSIRSDAAGTSLCLLPFLGAGQTHFSGRYKSVVSKGLRWLIDHQEPDGDLRVNSMRNAGMYAHGQAAIVLCEAYELTRDESLRRPAQLAIDFIVNTQHERGGWRYAPGQPGDVSVFGWQMMALQSARVAGLDIPQATFERAARFLDDCQTMDGALYSYMPDRRYDPSAAMTAEAILCRMYSGWNLQNSNLGAGIDFLLARSPPRWNDFNIYYWYYATQVMHHVGGRRWKRWNLAIRDILVESQEKRGHEAGSWDPNGPHADSGGRLYVTALAVCTLEVYYRHAPIFRQIDLD